MNTRKSQVLANRNWEEKNGIYKRTIIIREDEISKEEWDTIKDILNNNDTSISSYLTQSLKQVLYK